MRNIMDKSDFYKILCSSTPEEINHFISAKGKIKNVNAITFLDDQTLQDIHSNTDSNQSN